jgi:hypothetical protein
MFVALKNEVALFFQFVGQVYWLFASNAPQHDAALEFVKESRNKNHPLTNKERTKEFTFTRYLSCHNPIRLKTK